MKVNKCVCCTNSCLEGTCIVMLKAMYYFQYYKALVNKARTGLLLNLRPGGQCVN